eukprot:7979195-Alexandrium_andersonii.AAC.1
MHGTHACRCEQLPRAPVLFLFELFIQLIGQALTESAVCICLKHRLLHARMYHPLSALFLSRAFPKQQSPERAA